MSDGSVLISWTNPHDGSSPILETLVEIENAGQTNFFAETSSCGGIIAQVTQCSVSMSVLTQSPYNLVFDQQIVVRVSQRNAYGFKTPPTLNSGSDTRIRQIPSKMLPVVIESFTDTQVTVSWTSLTGIDTGNSEIIAYQLYYDNSLGTPNIKIYESLLNQLTINGLEGGKTYRFVVRAKNIYGEAA